MVHQKTRPKINRREELTLKLPLSSLATGFPNCCSYRSENSRNALGQYIYVKLVLKVKKRGFILKEDILLFVFGLCVCYLFFVGVQSDISSTN